MKIQLKRTGGIFSGLALNLHLDSETLDQKKAIELKEIMNSVKELNKKDADNKVPAERSMSKPKLNSAQIPDEFQYNLMITDSGKIIESKTSDASASPEMIHLIDWLIANDTN